MLLAYLLAFQLSVLHAWLDGVAFNRTNVSAVRLIFHLTVVVVVLKVRTTEDFVRILCTIYTTNAGTWCHGFEIRSFLECYRSLTSG